MFDDYANLRQWKEVAHMLAEDSDWPKLYDLEQLAQNTVNVTSATCVPLSFYAAVIKLIFSRERRYYDDM